MFEDDTRPEGDVVTPPPELAELAGATRTVDGAAAPGGGETPPLSSGAAIAVNPDELEAEEWALVPQTMGQIILPALPEVEPHWSRERCLEWGRAMAPVARRHGWKVDELFKWLGPWVMLAAVTHRMVTPTVLAGYRRVQAAREAAEKRKAEALNKGAPQPAAP